MIGDYIVGGEDRRLKAFDVESWYDYVCYRLFESCVSQYLSGY